MLVKIIQKKYHCNIKVCLYCLCIIDFSSSVWLKALLCIHVPAVYEKSSLIRCLQEAAEGQNDCIEEPTFVGAVLVCVSVVGSVQLLLLYKHVPHAQSWLKKKVCFLLKKERASAPCKSSSEM